MNRFRFLNVLVAALASSLAFGTLAEDIPAFKLTAKDGKFEPTTIEVPAGKRFKLDVTNAGAGAIEFESKPLRQEKVIAAGASASLTLGPLKAGSYKFFDEYHEATAQGMVVAK